MLIICARLKALFRKTLSGLGNIQTASGLPDLRTRGVGVATENTQIISLKSRVIDGCIAEWSMRLPQRHWPS